MPGTTPSPLPTESMRVKYRARNPVVRWMVGGFLAALDELVDTARPRSILEVGCGEGFLSERLRIRHPRVPIAGVDASRAILAVARRHFPELTLVQGSIDALPFPDGAYDLIVACEVLEHLHAPERALAEVRRVTRGRAILSVPREPIWRALNLARGKYVRAWGNTPGHLQHWSRTEFLRTVARWFEVREVRAPFPWTMVLVEAT